MVFRAMAMRAQRADCHDNCDGEAELVMEVLVSLYGIDCVALKGGISPIADDVRRGSKDVFLRTSKARKKQLDFQLKARIHIT